MDELLPVSYIDGGMGLFKMVGVTGASGHIGNVLCRRLLELGYRVRAMYHSRSESLQGLPLELIQGDVLNKMDVEKLVAGCDLVINCAAIISIQGDKTGVVFTTNTEGPKNILEACIAHGVRRIIHLSSTHAVMELPATMPYDETNRYKTQYDYRYDYSKARGEQIMLAGSNQLEVVVLRPSSVIGRYDFKPSEMGKALLDLYHGKVPFLPEGGYNYVDVRDVVKGIISAIDKGRSGEVYLLCGKYYPFTQIAEKVRQVTGKRTPKMVLPAWLLKAVAPLMLLYARLVDAEPLFTAEAIDALKNGHPNMDYTKAAKLLNYQPRPIEETLQDFYDWQSQQNRL